jgi:hypothetical protein
VRLPHPRRHTHCGGYPVGDPLLRGEDGEERSLIGWWMLGLG